MGICLAKLVLQVSSSQQLVGGHVAPGIDLLALGSAGFAAHHGSQVKLDSGLGDIDGIGRAEEGVDALLGLVKGGIGLGMDLADELLGTVTSIIEGGIVKDGLEVINGAAMAPLATTAASPGGSTAPVCRSTRCRLPPASPWLLPTGTPPVKRC